MPRITNPMRSSQRLLEAERIGHIALDTISMAQDGCVVGTTSRGIFIRSASKWLLFVTSEPFCSPLTINLGASDGLPHEITPGALIRISSQRLFFPAIDLMISAQNSAVWKAALPSLQPLSKAERRLRLNSTCEKIMRDKSGAGLAPLLPLFLGSTLQISQDPSPFQVDVIHRYEQMRSYDPPNSTEFIIDLLGFGSGLTPSGDDFVLGYLLVLNRWGSVLFPEFDSQTLNRQIVKAAYEKTTRLGANLIECAAQGQADERLIAALDWIMSGDSPDLGPIDEMLTWGQSSGRDVFSGFLFALSHDADSLRNE